MNGNSQRRRNLYRLLFLTALLCASGLILCLLYVSGAFLPRWIEWNNRSFTDAAGEYTVNLTGRRAEVLYQGRSVWHTDRGLKVQDAMSCDTDGGN